MSSVQVGEAVRGARVRRMVITTIDSITEMFKDYCGAEIPQDAKAITLRLQPANKGRLGILMESDSWPTGGEVEVKFQIKRMFGV